MKKILIIRFSSIGDIVLTSPVVRCVAQQTDSEIHFLTKESNLAVIQHNPHITKIFTIKKKLTEVLAGLRNENYDFVIDLHRNLRSRTAVFRLGRPSATFNKLNFRKWILVRLRKNFLPDVHIVDRYMKAALNLGIENDKQGLDYFISEADEVDIHDFPEAFRNSFTGFVIGGKHNTKIFPEEKVITACKFIRKPVVLLGGSDDSERGERIAQAAGENVINACGRYSINQSASLIRQAEAIITNDTGLMHIAAAYRKPVLSLWGNTIPGFGMYPYLPEGSENLSTILEIKDLRCRPCSKIGYRNCPKKHFDCMKRIDEGLISAWINSS